MSPVQQRALPYNLWSAVTLEKLKLKSWSHVKEKVVCVWYKRRRIQESNKFHLFIFIGDRLFNVYLLKLTSYLKEKRLKLYPNSRKVLHSRVYSEFHRTYHIGYALTVLWYFILQSTKLSMLFPYNIGAESANLMPCHQGGIETHFLRHVKWNGLAKFHER